MSQHVKKDTHCHESRTICQRAAEVYIFGKVFALAIQNIKTIFIGGKSNIASTVEFDSIETFLISGLLLKIL